MNGGLLLVAEGHDDAHQRANFRRGERTEHGDNIERRAISGITADRGATHLTAGASVL